MTSDGRLVAELEAIRAYFQTHERSHGWGHGWGRLGALHRWGTYS